MNSIKEITKKLFSVSYEKDFDDEEKYYEYLDIAEDLIKTNPWNEVFDCWHEYLLTKCKDETSILNFANLFWCYEGYKHKIVNPIDFCAFFYANINFKNHPEADYLLDGMTTEIFLYSGVYTQEQLYDYIPTNDPIIIEAAKKYGGIKQ